MITKHIPDALRVAFEHAVQHQDKHMLNLIELRLINALGIVPELAKPHQSWRAIGIVQKGRDLLFLWEERHSIKCSQCDGHGELEAIGKTRTISVECPDCDGSGNIEPEVGYNALVTDIDGAPTTLANFEDDEFIEPNGCTDELSFFIREKARIEKEETAKHTEKPA